MDSCDALIARIYAGVFEHPLATFKEATLASVNSLIPFDSGIWASGVHATSTIFSVAVYNYPLEQVVAYSFNWQEHDFVRAAAVAAPGRTLRNEDVMPLEDYHQSRIYLEYSSPSGIEQSLGTALADPVTTLGDLIYLFRADLDRPFTDAERDLKQRIAPYLEAAWRQKQVLQSYSGESQGPDSLAKIPSGHAVVDPSGHLHAADSHFSDTLAKIFPDWTGPLLPDALMPLRLANNDTLVTGGQRFVVRRGADRLLIHIENTVPLALLSNREQRVASLFADGLTQSEIAGKIGVSVSTVRNQIASTYRKLNVHTKVDLVRALKQR